MRYLCLLYYDEKKLEALSKSEYDALVAEALAYDDVIRQSGHYLASDALQSIRTATTIRFGNGRASTTDGPFAETKEQLGGFILIEAPDLDEALRVAAKMPPARLGCVEVRPVLELDPGKVGLGSR
ncbi:MAG TPA: YciI family protein [Thermoanaerobaculia bacterium]|nr:YciI family protein [Thermoanaerobaculia bacterium]